MKFYRLISISLFLCVVFPLISNADQLKDANTAITNGEYKKAFEILQPLAEQENEEAQTRLGALYINGQGVERDITKGLSWVMKAANRGNETARRIAFKVYLDLADQSDTAMLYNLGYMCLNGWGGEHDATVCTAWLENAGKIGHEKSLKLLEKIYTEGLYDITPDEENATYWHNLKVGFAAGLDGEWEGSVPMEDAPPMVLSYEFKTDGSRLTGTSIGYMSEKKRIDHGKIDGNHFSFTVKPDFGASEIQYTGVFMGDMIRLTYTTKASGHRSSHTRSLQNRFHAADDDKIPPVTFTAKRVE